MLRVRHDDDRRAFAHLVARHQRPLLNYFLRSGVQDDAEDLVQQTFLRLYRYRNRYRPTAKLTTFLYLMARQIRVDDLRRRRRQQRLRDRVTDEMTSGAATSADSTHMERRGWTDDLKNGLARLPQGARDVVVLGVLQGLSYPEVGAILGIPEGTVKSRMFHALRSLRAFLTEPLS